MTSDNNSASGLSRRAMLASGAALGVSALTTPARAQAQSTDAGAPATGTRRIGSLEVNPIGLGCMAMAPGFYNPPPARSDMIRLIRDAHEMGVNFYDTAEVYGPFISEEIVGEAIQPIREEIVLGTKFGFSFNANGGYAGRNSQPDHIKQAVEGMLGRLRTDYIDLLYLHRMDPNTPIEDIAGAVGELIAEGKVREFGVSEVNPETLRGAHAVTPVAAVQSEYSMLERLPEVAMLDTCEELGVSFVPWGGTMRGMLADNMNEYTRLASQDRRATVPFFSPEALETNMAVVALAREWAQRKDATPVQIALAWALAQRDFIVHIPGTTKWPHLKENLGATQVSFSESELAELRTALEALPVVGNRPESAAYENQ